MNNLLSTLSHVTTNMEVQDIENRERNLAIFAWHPFHVTYKLTIQDYQLRASISIEHKITKAFTNWLDSNDEKSVRAVIAILNHANNEKYELRDYKCEEMTKAVRAKIAEAEEAGGDKR